MTQVLLGAVSLGLLWAIMTIGVYITYRVLDIADIDLTFHHQDPAQRTHCHVSQIGKNMRNRKS